ncbi:Hypothetical predicted protein [Octopus vulgaris]|uniref:Uncharacterized protein n=1 Tax=Octopus vulgaris TaxID=6645 RepID=A0AA36BRN4_OCTVU|nr:Hypothetical predicted protein [Octopus vulgaris]
MGEAEVLRLKLVDENVEDDKCLVNDHGDDSRDNDEEDTRMRITHNMFLLALFSFSHLKMVPCTESAANLVHTFLIYPFRNDKVHSIDQKQKKSS